MDAAQQEFHAEEYKQIRTEVGLLLARVENLFRYSFIVTAIIYAWLITQSVGLSGSDVCLKLPVELLRPGWFVPPAFVFLTGLLAAAAYWRINQMGSYLKDLENVLGAGFLGWEKFLEPKVPVVAGVTIIVWLLLLGASVYGTWQGLAVAKDTAPACAVEPVGKT